MSPYDCPASSRLQPCHPASVLYLEDYGKSLLIGANPRSQPELPSERSGKPQYENSPELGIWHLSDLLQASIGLVGSRYQANL